MINIILFSVFIIILLERSYRIYQLKKLVIAQSHQLIEYKNKKEDFAMMMSRVSQNKSSDPISQLISQSDFQNRFDYLITQSKKFNNLFAILLLEIENPQDLDNTLANKLLNEAGKRLKETIRDVDIISRYEDNRFVLLLPNMVKPEVVVHGLERIIQKITVPYEIDSDKININVCIGASIYPFDGDDKQTLLANAAVALDKAKADGKNIFQFYQKETQALGVRELSLKLAVKNPDFLENILLEFKPYYNTKNQEMACIEVVASLNHPEFGGVSFNEVVRIAHYSSRMFELYEWMMKSSIEKVVFSKNKISKPRKFIFAFNLKQFNTPKFVTNIISIIKKLSSPDNQIIMEIKDDDLTSENLELFREAIPKLNESNIPIAIGILLLGQFALSKLDHVVFSYLKIDEKLVKDLNKRKESQAMLEKLMSLANGLKITTLTAGVDTVEQQKILENLGYVILQGKIIKKTLLEDFSM